MPVFDHGHDDCLRTPNQVEFIDRVAVNLFACNYCMASRFHRCRSASKSDVRTHEVRRQEALQRLRDCGGIWPWDEEAALDD